MGNKDGYNDKHEQFRLTFSRFAKTATCQTSFPVSLNLNQWRQFLHCNVMLLLQQATFNISIFKHGSEAFGSKLQIFQVSFVPQFPKETLIQRKQHQIQRFDLKASEPCYKYGLLTTCEVKMAGYWPSSFLRVVEVHKLAKKERGQYPAILNEQTWSIKDLLYGFW